MRQYKDYVRHEDGNYKVTITRGEQVIATMELTINCSTTDLINAVGTLMSVAETALKEGLSYEE